MVLGKVKTGLDRLVGDIGLRDEFKGNIGLLCHNASVDSAYVHASLRFKQLFGTRFVKLFGPQHGFNTDAQDNMIETDHFVHPYFEIPVFSLYSETRIPTDDMLKGIDHLFVDLQDIGSRMYTYIYTLTLLLEKCAGTDIDVIVLDRPNPMNGVDVEGNILDEEYSSFIGRHPMPVRHAMTIGEVAMMHQKFWAIKTARLRVIEMQNWERGMYFEDTGLPWVSPSPNIARPETTIVFPAIVGYEGTLLSEGRGTTQPLETVGHPGIEPYSFYTRHLSHVLESSNLKGFAVRPITFLPTFDKHMNEVCGGFQIHVTDRSQFRPWRVGYLLMRELYHYLQGDFQWRNPPFEYDYTHMPIDIINGTDVLRKGIESNASIEILDSLESHDQYREHLSAIKLY